MALSPKSNITDINKVSHWKVHTGEYSRYYNILSSYSKPNIKKILKEYFAFMMVRHPLERLASSYHNKLKLNITKFYKKHFGRTIIGKYRYNPSIESLQQGNDVTFEEFLKYLSEFDNLSLLDEHWKPFYHVCHPCAIKYNAIGHMENMSDDIEYILQRSGLKGVISYPIAKRPKGKPPASELLIQYLQNVSHDLVGKVWKRFEIDFKMFNYSISLS